MGEHVYLPPKPAIRSVPGFHDILGQLVSGRFPLWIEMAPFHMPVSFIAIASYEKVIMQVC